jgi:hypothetical protein
MIEIKNMKGRRGQTKTTNMIKMKNMTNNTRKGNNHDQQQL